MLTRPPVGTGTAALLLLALTACGGGPPVQRSPLRLPVVAGAAACTPLTTQARVGPAVLDVQNDGAGPLTLVVARASDGLELARAGGVPPADSVQLRVELEQGETVLICIRDGARLGAPVRFSTDT